MTFEEMKKIVVDTLSCDEDKVTMEASLTEDLEADSLDAVELNMALEDACGVSVPDEELAKRDAETPAVTGLPIEDAKTTLNNSSLGFSVLGDGDTVVQQIPEAGQPVPQNGTIVLYTDQQSVQNSTATVPNLVGLSAAEAVAAAENAGINIKVSGNSEGAGAESVSQSVAENTLVSKGTVVTVEFVVPDNVE